MTEIRKYSKDWFATNGTQEQKVAIKKLPRKKFDELNRTKNNGLRTIDKSLFVGSREKVHKNFEKFQKNEANKEQVDLINELGGVDLIYDILNADGNKKITKQEIADMAATNTPEWEDDNQFFSAYDLQIIYDNVMAADGVKVENDEINNESKYKYKDGSETIIVKDDDGNIRGKIVKENLAWGEKQETIYSYDEKISKQVLYDSQGREIREKYDSKGTKNDVTLTTSYTSKSTMKTINTVGRTLSVIYDEDGNIVNKTEKYKYNLENTPFEQQSIDECWLLSQTKALMDTPHGQKIIDDSIKQNEDGSVTVTLKGADRSYTYSPERLCSDDYMNTSKKYARGNYKVRAIELAFTDFRKELLKDTNKIKFKLQYSYGANEKDPLKAGYFKEAIQFLTGIEPETSYTKSKIEKELEKKKENPEQYAMVTSFIKEDASLGRWENRSKKESKIITMHEYSISRVTEDTVFVINPWDTSVEIPYPKDKFLKNAFGIGVADLSEYKEKE